MSNSTRQALANRPGQYSSEPEGAGLLRNKCGCGKSHGFGGACPGCRSEQPAAPLDFTGRAFGESPAGHDLSRVPVLASGHRPNDETTPGGSNSEAESMKSKAAEPEEDIDAGERGISPVVDKVEMITGPGGAVSGYDATLECHASLNTPGIVNDLSSIGSVANVHQVHFHLSKGHPRDVRAVRVVNRTAHAFGKDWPESKYDGPPVHEYRFTKDKMVIADAPGWCKNMPDHAFPVDYKADFSLYAYETPTMKVLASISYHVEISKAHFSHPGATNYVEVTDTKIGAAVPSPIKKKK
jgi:hypothetical protein